MRHCCCIRLSLTLLTTTTTTSFIIPRRSAAAFFYPRSFAAVVIMSKRPATSSNNNKQQKSMTSFFQASSPKRSKLSAAAASGDIQKASNNTIIYVDLDGVLVDFDAGLRKLFPNQATEDVPSKLLWPTLARTQGFFRTLPWTSDGQHLWQALLLASSQQQQQQQDNKNMIQLRILTGCPTFAAAALDKYAWCQRHLQGLPTVHIP
jgi:hypothetical protein